VLLESLGSGLKDQAFTSFVVTLKPGASSGNHVMVHPGHEWVFCLQGELGYEIAGEPYRLARGDALLFRAEQPHRWSNPNNKPVMFLLICMATVVAFFCTARYRLPVVPVLILLSAQGLAQLPRLWQSRKLAPLGAYAGVGCLAALFLAANPPEDREADARQMEGMAHYNLAMHYLQPERAQPEGWEKAIEHLKQALELRPNDGFFPARARLSLAMAHMRLGVHLHDAGQPEKSEEQFALALRIEPDHAEPRTFYAAFLHLTGRLDEAAAQYHKALELQPDSSEARFELGLVLAERGRYAQAIDLLREALAAAQAGGQTDFAAEIEVELRRCERESADGRDE